jgi:hypothetical protein
MLRSVKFNERAVETAFLQQRHFNNSPTSESALRNDEPPSSAPSGHRA